MKPLFIFLCLFVLAINGHSTMRLARDLTVSSMVETIPFNTTVVVDLQLSLIAIRDVDSERNEVEVVVWLGTNYQNRYLVWDPEKYDNIDNIALGKTSVWLPDITLYNAVSPPETTMDPPPKMVVNNDGHVWHFVPMKIRFSCHLGGVGTSEGAECAMKFGSWVYNGFQVDFTEVAASSIDMSDFSENPHYDVIERNAEKQVVHYSCCPEPYPNVLFSITIRKKDAKRGYFWQ